MRLFTILALAMLCLSVAGEPVSAQEANKNAPAKIYIAPDDHTDYFWTADDVAYRAAFIEMLDYYLDQIEATKDDPEAYQARWNCDGSLWLWEYEKNKSPEDFQRLIEAIRSGHVSSPSTALASTYGAQPAEAVLRGMYYAGRLEREHDLRFTMGVAMENQTLPLGLGALWSGAGVKYSWRGVCGCATKMPIGPMRARDREIYWWTGTDGSRVLMKWNSLFGKNEAIGGYAEARDPRQAIDFVRNDKNFRTRYPFPTVGLFGKGWDDLKTLSDEFPKVAREKTNDEQQVIVSNEEDFFIEFEKEHGDAIETESLAYGNEWDLYCASMAEQTSRVRRAVEQLRTAEAMATLASLDDPAFWDGLREEREQAHMDIGLYWEHDWTADNTEAMRSKRAAWQRRLADRISQYSDRLYAQSAKKLSGLIESKDGTNRFAVFNGLGWKRNAAVEIPTGISVPKEFHVVDVATQKTIPSQVDRIDNKRVARIFANDLPSVGYRVYEIREGAGKQFSDSAVHDVRMVENALIRFEADGDYGISRLFDKKNNIEIATGAGLCRLSGNTRDAHALTGTSIISSGPVSTTLKISAPNPLMHETRLTLIRDADWIQVDNTIEQNFQDVRSWSFDFAFENPDVRHEEIGAVLRAKLAQDGGHYASRNARYEWLSLGHFVDMSGESSETRSSGRKCGITIANADCSFFQLGNSTPNKLDTSTASIKILAGGQVDGARLGIRRQHGDTHFTQRFAIRPRGGDFEATAAMRWSIEWQNPPVAIQLVQQNNKQKYSATNFSFVTNSSDDVLLWALKPAEEGIEHGIVARLWNLSDNEKQTQLQISKLNGAHATTHLETNVSPIKIDGGKLPATFNGNQMRSFRLLVD